MNSGTKDLCHDLGPSTLEAILNNLPVEITYVDSRCIVRYFNREGQKKIMPRARAVVGKPVQNCHPPKSRALVVQVLDDLKSGKDAVEAWFDRKGKKIHVIYKALRNIDGKYIGCLETVQDITRIQELTDVARPVLREE